MHRTLTPWLWMAATALLALAPLSSQEPPPSARTRFVPVQGEREFSGRMIARPFQLKDLQARGMDRAEALAHRAAARQSLSNFRIREYVPETDETILFVPAGMTENQVAAQLMATGDFQYVEPDWIVFPIACPNDPRFGSQWHHQANRLDSCAGWNITTGNPSVSVGICDTGVLTTHEDLQLHRLEGYNAVDRLWESQGGQIGPVHPHGTMTTGCAAANGNNGIGVSGVGWDFSHRMLRVSNSSSGSASLSDLQNAARTAVQAGDKVASVSYSGVDTSSNLTTATFIKSIGGLLVWAAGNDGRNLTFGNRDNDDIIVAGATDPNDSIASFSAFGAFVDVTAPGVNVLTTDGSGNTAYAAVSGTSFATPLTAGLIALIWSANPALTPDQVEGTLKQGADDLGAAGIDNTFGYGRINVFNSVSLAGGGGGTPPVADFTGSPTTGTAPLTVDFTDQSTGAPASWAWDFGDGNTSSAQNPSHVYANAGTFTVSMTASNANGSDTLVRSGYITVNTGGSPPVADFTGSPTTGTAPLTVDFTDQSTGAPASWAWDFGDGNTSSAQNPSHVYANAGTFTVSMTASNANGSDVLVRNNYITVNPGGGFTGEGFILSKNPDFSTDDRAFSMADTIYMLVWSDKVDFTNMRKNRWELKDSNKNRVRQPLTNNGDGSFSASFALAGLPSSAQNWTWKGKIEDKNRVKFRPSASITVTSGGGSPPVANFTGSPTSGTVPLAVDFTDLSSGAPTSWAWDFGDGGTSSSQNPAHVYTAAGTYSVTLAATNANGTDQLVRSGYISVTGGGTPPVADFSGTPTAGTAPLTVSFSDLSSGAPTSWAWDFGDGSTSSSQNPAHVYTVAGTYTVTLTVSNANGTDQLVRTGYISVSPGGGFSGEGFLLSKNPDFSTDDRTFTRNDTIYMLVWSDRVDFTNMRKTQWELRDNNKRKVKKNLTNNGDGSFTASFNLSSLPSSATSWRWKGKIEDNNRTKFNPQVQISVF